jgi:ribosomal-protein-alanine N-acetyltransferase
VIPHPYAEGVAEQWIATHTTLRNRGAAFVCAVTQADDGLLVGAIEVRLAPQMLVSLGYWTGRPYWGLGYATAAARAMVAMSFGYLDCNRLTSSHLARNAASARVLEKCGFAFVRDLEREHRGRAEIFCVRELSRDAWEHRLESL